MIAGIAHKITAFLLVFILFAHNINTLVIIGDFLANQAVIAKNFCIQKDNQQGCNGKCQLTKELKQSTPESNTDLPAQETRRLSLDVFCLFQIARSTIENEAPTKLQNAHFYFENHLIPRYQDIETPPPNFS